MRQRLTRPPTGEPGTPAGRGVRAGWAIAYRTATMLGAAGLAALAFARDTVAWDVVGAVLVAFAISDAILLVVVAWFRRRHRGNRPPASRAGATDDLA